MQPAEPNTSERPMISDSLISIIPKILSLIIIAPQSKSVEDIVTSINIKSVELSKNGYLRKEIEIKNLYDAVKNLEKEKLVSIPYQLNSSNYLSLILHDGFDLSCLDLSRALGLSVGSIRTQLLKTRCILFDFKLEKITFQKEPLEQTAHHHCLFYKDAVEDLVLSEFNSFIFSSNNNKECSHCKSFSDLRKISIDYFSELKTTKFSLSKHFNTHAAEKTSPFERLLKKIKTFSSLGVLSRSILQAFLASAVILMLVLSLSPIKRFYESWHEKRLENYSPSELIANLGTDSEDSKISQTVKSDDTTITLQQDSPEQTKKLSEKTQSEFIGRDKEILSTQKIYRVLLTSENEENVISVIKKELDVISYEIASPTSSNLPDNLPGGYLFDVFIEAKKYSSLIDKIHLLGKTKIIITKEKGLGKPNKAHLKIWLQKQHHN